MVTFADMVTLLLTFLVMVVSITTLDPHTVLPLKEGVVLERPVDSVQLGDGALLFADQGKLAPVIELAANLDKLPPDVMFDQQEIKNAIFQLDPAKTPDYERMRQAADEGVSVFRDNRGLVIQWDRSLIFAEGDSRLLDEHLGLLQSVALFLKSLSLPVSIEGHTNPLSPAEGGSEAAAYALSLARSKAVMEYLAGLGVAEARFRLGGYGGARPRNLDPDAAWENSRLEIVVYKPEPTSLFGR
jgi:chemotaxis protein MotB